jgi:hypothetical protein
MSISLSVNMRALPVFLLLPIIGTPAVTAQIEWPSTVTCTIKRFVIVADDFVLDDPLEGQTTLHANLMSGEALLYLGGGGPDTLQLERWHERNGRFDGIKSLTLVGAKVVGCQRRPKLSQ